MSEELGAEVPLEAAPVTQAKKREMSKLEQIGVSYYEDTFRLPATLSIDAIDPNDDDIAKAVNENRLDSRNYQSDLEAMKAEWLATTDGGINHPLGIELVTAYHAAAAGDRTTGG